jgi:predicted transcriptional regulator
MQILLSIKPEFAELILRGEKTYEFRRVVFRDESVRSALIYATKPIGKIVGKFDIAKVISGSPGAIWEKTKHRAGVTRTLFTAYFAGRRVAHALAVAKTTRFRTPVELKEVVPSGIAPQSFRYIKTSRG